MGKIHNLNLSELLFILLPLLLITGPFLSDLSISLIVLIFLFNFKTETHIKYFKNIYFYFFLIFNIWIITSSLFSSNAAESLQTSFLYFRFYVFSLAVWFILDANEQVLKYFFYSLLLAFLILIVDGFFQYIHGSNILGWPVHPGPRISSFFKDELILGSYLSRFIALIFGLILYYFKDKKIILYLLSFIVLVSSETLIFLSGERVAFFFINLSCIILILFLNKYNLLRFLSYFLSILFILFLVFLSPLSKNRIIDKTIKQTGIFTTEKVLFSSEHEKIFRTGFEMFKKNKIFGIGANNFKNKCKSYENNNSDIYKCATHPHNTYIELLAETGLIGFLMIATIFIYLNIFLLHNLYLKIFKKHMVKLSNLEICIIAGFYINLFPIIPTGSFFNNYLSIVYWLPVGIFLWKRNKNFNN
jgi:O-antigen ligase